MVHHLSDFADVVPGDKARCIVCKKVYGQKTSNWLRHYEKKHLAELKAIGDGVLAVITAFTTKEAYIENLMAILTQCNTTFSFWSHPAARANQKCYAEKFGVNVSASSMAKFLVHYAQSIRNTISDELEGRLISIKFDIATRKHRSIIGISVQFIRDWKIEIRYLAMASVPGSATAELLRDIIDDCLKIYRLDKRNIYSVTTDNGPNVLKTSRVLLEEIDWAIDQDDRATIQRALDEFGEADDDEEDDTTTTEPMSGFDYEDLQLQDISDDEPEQLRQNLETAAATFGDKSTRCAAHVIQLAVHDFMKRSGRKEFLTTMKDTVKDVRAYIRNMPEEYRNRPKLPALPNDTRWNSTYNMVSTFLKSCR